MKCHYCEQEATKTLVWLKDKHRRPARIRLPWCGCDLMTALRKIWPCPYPVQEGQDYEIEVMRPPIENMDEKLAALQDCITYVEAKNDGMASYEDVLGHLFDLIHHFNHGHKSLAELCEIYGGEKRVPNPGSSD